MMPHEEDSQIATEVDSPSHVEEEPEEDTQTQEEDARLQDGAEGGEEELAEAEPSTPKVVTAEDAEPEDNAKPKAKRKREALPALVEPGKSVFPVSRVQRILKADKDMPMVSREAVLLISLATEEFVARVARTSGFQAEREGRNVVQRRDLALAVRRADEFWFLEELIQWHDPEAEQRRKPKALQKGKGRDDDDDDEHSRPKTLLDQFVIRKDGEEEEAEDGDGDGDVVMNEDGTMSMGAVADTEDS